ncbi:MAG: GrpB family protein [Oscillospiraceae bacterium]|nr:GrpB family protein [Oscillospiraceae bacterium]
MQGVPRQKVVLETHRAEWAEEFDRVKRQLQSMHGENAVNIQHVGSTAIDGIMAKPMLDVAVLFRRIDDSVFSGMAENGYVYYGEVASGKHLFILRGQNEVSLQHVHCYEVSNSGLFYEQLRFRDFLRSHPAYAREYEALKIKLLELYADDRKKYTAGKQAFFDKIKLLATQD